LTWHAHAKAEQQAHKNAYNKAIEQAKTQAEQKITKLKAQFKQKIKLNSQQTAQTDRQTANIKQRYEKTITALKDQLAEKTNLYNQHAAEIQAAQKAAQQTRAQAHDQIEKAKAHTQKQIQQVKNQADQTIAQIKNQTEKKIKAYTDAIANIKAQARKKAHEDNTQKIKNAAQITAKDIMQNNVLWACPEDSIQDALDILKQNDTQYLMVGTSGKLEGIISEPDLTAALSPYLRPAFAKWRRPLDDATLQIKIKWIMTASPHTITPQTTIPTITQDLRRFKSLAFPVIDNHGKVLGLVTILDITNALLK
jgi:acetoin utilization protein AcuB